MKETLNTLLVLLLWGSSRTEHFWDSVRHDMDYGTSKDEIHLFISMDFAELMSKEYIFENKNENEINFDWSKRGIS